MSDTMCEQPPPGFEEEWRTSAAFRIMVRERREREARAVSRGKIVVLAADLAWANAYVGLPWRDLGRERDGCDCWGNYRLMVGELAGLWVESHSGDYASASEIRTIERVLRGELDDNWIAVDEPRPLDMAIFRRGRWDSHVAAVLDRRRFLHMVDFTCSKVGWFADPEHGGFTGFWRHRDMPEVVLR